MTALPQATGPARIRIGNGPISVTLARLGAAITELRMEGIGHSLILGAPSSAPYLSTMRHFGAIVGPVANRIAGARASMGGRTISLIANEGRNTLHSGPSGSSLREWTLAEHGATYARFTLHWADGDCGFSGPMELSATYRVAPDGALHIDLSATSQALTLCNPAFHGYWSLDGSGALTGHRMMIHAQSYLPVDAEKIPLGHPADVAGTRFDFRLLRPIAADGALDHNFCLVGEGMRPVLRLETEELALDLATDAAGLQVYDGAQIDTAPHAGHEGHPYGAYAGIALEPQSWPDAPNHPTYPDITLGPEGRFCQRSVFRLTRKPPP